jgi:hypothetical protein
MPTVKKLRNYKGAISLESLDPSAYKLGVEQYRSNNVANPSVKRTANGNANRNRNRNGNNGNRNNGNRNKTAKRSKTKSN